MIINYPPEIIWIKENKDSLNLTAVAKKIGVPRKAFWNYCNDVHSLNSKWWHPVQKWVKKITTIKPIEQ